MKVRGRRECEACGARWSYFDTGEVTCPDCGSLHSVGLDDERALHTASTATLDLAPVRNDLDDARVSDLAGDAADRCRSFTRGYGFIDGGDLQPLDDTYLAAQELLYVGRELDRRMTVEEAADRYLTALLRADEGERPDPAAVPADLRAMRGLAYATAVGAYRSDLRTYLGEHPDPPAERVNGRLGDHQKRIEALDGDVPPRDAEALVAAARDLGRYLVDGDEAALAEADSRLDDLA
jgi:uncharacterized Zn finger protein (UPF0148 family)